MFIRMCGSKLHNCSDNIYLSEYAYFSLGARILPHDSKTFQLLQNVEKSYDWRAISKIVHFA